MEEQFILDFEIASKAARKFWRNPLLIPFYVSLLSIVVVIVQAILDTKPVKRLLAKWFNSEDELTTEEEEEDHDRLALGLRAEVKEHIKLHGGARIFTWKLLRFAGCLALVGLTIAIVAVEKEGDSQSGLFGSEGRLIESFKEWGKKKKHKKRKHANEWFTNDEWYQLSLLVVFLYTSFLSLISVLAPLRRSRRAASHLVTVLLITFSLYAYRDLWPLATFTLDPLDRAEGGLLWARVGLLTFVGALVPLCIPRKYTPIDPKNPQSEPNPEQTASVMSFLFFTFLDPIIFLAYRSPHLPIDKLPVLCDYDRTSELVKRSFKYLDPMSERNRKGKMPYLFWNLMSLFWKQYLMLMLMIFIKVLTGFLAPLTINRLLYYIEKQGQGAIVRPWLWIAAMFLGPVIGSMAFQYYIYLQTGAIVRVEGIITQLVFEHSLRIRLVEKRSNSAGTSAGSTGASTAAASRPPSPPPSDSHEATSSTSQSGGSDETLAASASTIPASEATAVSDAQKTAAGPVTGPSTPFPTPNQPEASSTTESNLVGKINNLVTVDTTNIVDARDFLFILWYCPLELGICCWFLFVLLEWSAVIGILTILICFPIPGYLAKVMNRVQSERMKKTDARTQGVTEVMGVLRMIKLFAWESKMQEQLDEKRDDELKWIKYRQLLQLGINTLNYVIPLIALLTTFGSYTLIWKRELTAATVFSAMPLFDMLRDQLHISFYMVSAIIQGKVSLDRIDDFLRNSELLDEFKNPSSDKALHAVADPEVVAAAIDDRIGFQDATFSWSDEEQSGTLTPSRRAFRLRVEGDLFFKRGQINLIVGPTGSGKTSMLYALLGEMHFLPSEPRSWFGLPRSGGVAYAAQESWVQNETIRDNILFGSTLDQARYDKVLHQCCLETDLTLFDAGDRTEVGEKGLTLSGGQKARITLARAIYSRAEILLLDDILAALDVHTAKWIVDKCLQGDLVEGRTIVLVTHNISMAGPIADYVVSLGLDGRVLSKGSMQDALQRNSKLLSAVKAEEKENASAEKNKEAADQAGPDAKAQEKAGKLIVAEEVAEGHVRWPALKMYFLSMGGIFFWIIVFTGDIAASLFTTVQTWWLGHWARQYTERPSSEVSVALYLGGYALLMILSIVGWLGGFVVFVLGSIKASRKLYRSLTEAILGTTLRWLDVVPTSRVIARCTQDMRAVDGPIPSQLADIIDLGTMMITRLAGAVVMAPIFLLPGMVIGVFGGWCGQVYIKAQLCVKREMSNARSPVLGHFGAAIAGLTSLRAYGAQGAFRVESMKRVDVYIRAGRSFYNLNRWICEFIGLSSLGEPLNSATAIRIDALGALFASALAAYLVYGHTGKDASDIGFSLNMAVSFAGAILWLVRIYNDFEVQGNSLERIQDYIEIEQEPKPTDSGKPPAYWPASGDIHVENLSARYSIDGPEVLHQLSFSIRSGERIGVVGRTSSGKSSLTLSLLRCIFTSGSVHYDGIDTTSINLDALRSNITIIPQQPELITGSLRQNLDPFGQVDDAAMNNALRAAGLFSLQEADDEARIGLDSAIASGGSNLSVGQRQILALARAIIRGSKLLILDEATSAIDYNTDNIIQESIRRELKDVTLITVAHRLQTIMDADRIMVLNAGRLEEYDTPANLLQNPSGLLRALVDESGDKDKLYGMAKQKRGDADESKADSKPSYAQMAAGGN